MLRVQVVVPKPLCLAQANAVDDGRVIERVADYGVLLPEQHFEEARIGVKARPVQDCGFHSVELGDAALQLSMAVRGTADEAHRRKAVAPVLERGRGSGRHAPIPGQAQVVVCAEVQQRVRGALHRNGWVLARRGDLAVYTLS